jgi:histidinol-phosphatase
VPNDLDKLLKFAHGLLDETDAIAMRHFAGELTISEKHDRTLVTQADTEIETLIRGRIAKKHRSHGVVGEEFGTEKGDEDARWIVDPIDATHNFVRAIPVFATLLALERDGDLVLGVVSAPALAQRWWAISGEGAFTRDAAGERRIHVSAIDSFNESQLLFSTLRGLDDVNLAQPLLRASHYSWRDRGFGDFWGHMLVAQGSAEAMLEYGVSPWDMAAPYAIVREAGGRMTDLENRPGWSGPQALTTNGLIHDEMLEHLVPA